MGYINFDKNQLVNLEYALSRELIRSNRAGSYASTTIIGCNTRKYHGLLITPQPAIDNGNHVLLSTLDESVLQQGSEFNLGIHGYPGGVYFPKGHRYIKDFTIDPYPVLTIQVGGVILTKEMIFISNDDRILIKYTLVDAHSPTILRFKPYLAFRNVHILSKKNMYVDRRYEKVGNGIGIRMYQGYTDLFMQFSKVPEYVHVPDWYYNIEYLQEKERGYEHLEDLYVPGYFELPIRKGESIIFSAGIKEINPTYISKAFNTEIKKRIPRSTFENCLVNAAQQFIVKKGKRTEITAGFPWFGRWGRDTFISLPGLTLVTGEFKLAKEILDTMVSDMDGPLFPNMGEGNRLAYNSVDAPLWFFWALQQYAGYAGENDKIWEEYGKKLKLILKGYRDGSIFGIKMNDDGLIKAGEPGKALTWMDAIVFGKPVTPRMGMPVEINALWYNAVMFSLEMAKLAGDKSFIKEWESIVENIPASFTKVFWSEKKGYLADSADDQQTDWTIRPNQVFATSLPYSPITQEIRKQVLSRIRQELLTPRGLRTLPPSHPDYKGTCFGDQPTRDLAYHQGTVWPWLLGHFAEGYLKLHGKGGLDFIKCLYAGFGAVMSEHGIGTISEIYDGDPPHSARGAISQAWSVAELLRMNHLIRMYDKMK
ncbi:MAG: amylo-alpha-1,6-glucosidase [Bacteroidetes bacterium]|nr:amylo-alpha-1,6-glucosidase [Bacteroidota bacterium]